MNDGVAHSFLLLCGVLDLLVSIGKDGKVDHSRLGDLIVRHLEAYIAVFGGDEFFPKCHYSIHLPELFRKHGTSNKSTNNSKCGPTTWPMLVLGLKNLCFEK